MLLPQQLVGAPYLPVGLAFVVLSNVWHTVRRRRFERAIRLWHETQAALGSNVSCFYKEDHPITDGGVANDNTASSS